MSGSWIRVNLNGLTGMGQANTAACWFAGLSMLYVWKGLDPGSILQTLRDAGVDADAALNLGLLRETVVPIAKALGLSYAGFGQSISVGDLKSRLPSSPLWISGNWAPGSRHIRVVTGASDDMIEYFDPWWGGSAGIDFASTHTDLADNFIHGNGKEVKGTDIDIGHMQILYWK